MNRQNQYKDDDSSENDFSSDGQSKNQIQFRGKKTDQQPVVNKSKQLPSLERNVPFMIKYNNFFVRTIWTVVMLLGYITIINAGHFYVASLVFLINIAIFKEILSLKRNYDKEIKIPLFYLLNWYFFAVAVFYFYGKLFSSKLTRYVLSNWEVSFVINYLNIIAFMLWIVGFLLFVLSLKQGYYRYQFRMFGWTHITLLMVVAQSSVMIQNTYEGLAWFLLPSILVITNDIFAYIFGICFGRTKLIDLSPKKTWEGFIGGSFSTLLAAFIIARELQNHQYLICPMQDIIFTPFESVTCEPSSYFVSMQHESPFGQFNSSEFQIHAMIISLFASLIAPFGGFFASGFKRAIKIKDFADMIPGHGGVTDRMDCQILTGMFTYLYLHQIILTRLNSVSSITNYIMGLSAQDQILIFRELQRLLQQQRLI